MKLADLKLTLIEELSYVLDFGNTENEIFDNLMALLEVLRVQEIISTESYEDAECKLQAVWGFDSQEAGNQ